MQPGILTLVPKRPLFGEHFAKENILQAQNQLGLIGFSTCRVFQMFSMPRFKEGKMLQDCEVRFPVRCVFFLAFADPSTPFYHRISMQQLSGCPYIAYFISRDFNPGPSGVLVEYRTVFFKNSAGTAVLV